MTGPGLQLALATPDDTRAIEALVEHTESAFDIRAELQRRYARLFVARRAEGAQAIAFLLAWHVADELHVIDLVVAAPERRRGVARRLLAFALEDARTGAARRALLEVRKGNGAAIALYRSFGFEEAGERLAYYRDGEDALLMQLELPA